MNGESLLNQALRSYDQKVGRFFNINPMNLSERINSFSSDVQLLTDLCAKFHARCIYLLLFKYVNIL